MDCFDGVEEISLKDLHNKNLTQIFVIIIVKNRKANHQAILLLYDCRKTLLEIYRDLGVSWETVCRTSARGRATACTPVRSTPARPPEVLEAVQDAMDKKEGKVTIKGLACEHTVSETIMRRLMQDDLGLSQELQTHSSVCSKVK